ncbi:MAG: two-component regulator propeller domain-containing protein, partial [Dehalococcoidales bacterium]|nr:two-component regulator propeller domain-containing protein [Dehalococcoidales bacterium]
MLKEQMSRHSQSVICWAVLVVCLVTPLLPASAQAAGGSGDLWQSFGVGDGLRSGNVSAVYAAFDGSLWFGTDAGVSSFDGHQWQTLGAAEGLPADRVRAIAQTGDGAFWFATKTAGLARRLPGTKCCQTWSTLQGLPSNDVWALLPAAASPAGHGEPGLWVGTAQGLVYLDGTRVLRDSPLADAAILALAAGPDAALYVSANGRGIWQRSRAGEWRVVNGSAPPTGEVFALLVEADGRLWAGTQSGLFFYDSMPRGSGQGGTWQRFPLAGLTDGPVVFAVVQDRTGGLWLGTDQGLFYDADARSDAAPIVQWRAQRDGLVSDYVRAMAFGG